MRKIQCVFLSLFLPASVWAATTSGELRTDETWEGLVLITGDVVVPANRVLTIKPNALIRFAANQDDQESGYDPSKCELIVEGTLRAEGKEKYEIRFTSSSFSDPDEEVKAKLNPQAGDWYGLVLKKDAAGRSILSNTIIEYAYDGITCVNSSPRIYRNRIEANYWNGVLCDIISSPKLNNNQILNNGYAGINCMISSSPVITGNEITGNRYGILVQDVSNPVIGDVRDVQGDLAGRNIIYNNLEYNLYNHTKRVLYAQRNDWGDNINADRLIHDDDESGKFGLVVYAPVFTSGKISYVEYQALTASAVKPTEDETKKKTLELAELKKKLEADKKQKTESKSGVKEETPKEDLAELKRKEEERTKEMERVRLLEEQLKQQEQIRLEQEKQLAMQKRFEEEERLEKQKAAAAAEKKKETKPAASSFVATKMANELDNNPKPIQRVSPTLPDLARQAKISGTVSLRVLIGVNGVPEEVYVAKRIGNKDFDQMINDEAIRTVKQWTFEQGLSAGVPVKYWTIVNLLFK